MGCLLGLSAAFIWAAHNVDGWRGVAAFFALLFFTYGANVVFVRDSQVAQARIVLAVARWVVYLITFFPMVVIFDLPVSVDSWDGRQAAVHLWAAFFTLILVLELLLFGWLAQAANLRFGDGSSTRDTDDERTRQYRRLYGMGRKK